MWKLDSSGRYLENIMKIFCEKSNYFHNACSMIINLEDEHWKDCLIDKESKDIYKVFKRQRTQLPDGMRLFLDVIPVSDNIEILFNHINNRGADPDTRHGLYFSKTALLYSLDLFRT
ncbi:hypothetical protein RMATCC62417_02424 [Rhizopus microsporus]|nr:hypothetical protein RMATCC62417_02424 [Rhizopus microsporus]